MSISKKLLLSFSACLIAAVLLVSFCLFQMVRLRGMTDRFIAQSESVTAATQAAGLGPISMRVFQSAILSSDPEQAEAEWFTEVKGSATGQLETIEKIATGEAKEFFTTIQTNFVEMSDVFEKELLPAVKAKTLTPAKSTELIDKLNIKAGVLGDASLRLRNVWLAAIDQDKVKLQKLFRISFVTSIASLVVAICLGIVLVIRVSRSIARPLEQAITELTEKGVQTQSLSQNFSSAAQVLAQSASTQASAVQETSAALEEMSSMINKSAESATSSATAAQRSVEIAEKGSTIAGQMLQAIETVTESNADIGSSVEASNQRLSEITKVIGEIANKTRVINDIVFQTKLLSFNASVEAARAGEHGKGFAVVAEEVGNLARMSGSAASEIDRMLSESIRKVEAIVSETTHQVQGLITDGKAKVKRGAELSQQTSTALNTIGNEAKSVNTLVADIGTATREQALGVQEIVKAVGQIDTMMNQTSSVSNDIDKASQSLSNQAHELNTMVSTLKTLVYGDQK